MPLEVPASPAPRLDDTPIKTGDTFDTKDTTERAGDRRIAPGRSFLLRFVDRFLQEQNIKWILTLGVMILLGSSVKLVGTRWNEVSAAWRHLILLGYTAAIFGISRVCYWRFGLRKTGTVLMGLTVLLVPIAFFGLHFVPLESAAGLWPVTRNLALLAANLGLGWIAASRIFTHFLRGAQPTFTASYLVLAAAAAVVPWFPATVWPAVALFLWGVFAVGTVKINRHVFWMTEEHRLPRIFGFFPILLLGTQFLLLFAWQIGPRIPLDWLGLACVLTAVPVLLTADAVARVFQQRTGDLVRPLPWAVMLPLVIGLALCALGTIWALAQGLLFPMALVPTAAIAAAMMAIVARRTGHRAFVWAMLLLTLLAYNFSYVFFREVAAQVIHTGARAIHEARLPLAYYGLTYLPFLAATTGIATMLERRGRRRPEEWQVTGLFVRPMQLFTVGLCSLLLMASLTHEKATFPVSLALTAMFGLQTAFFRDRQLLVPAIASLILAAFGFAPFVTTVGSFGSLFTGADSTRLMFHALTATAGLLLVPGMFVDRWARRLPERGLLWRNNDLTDAPPRDWCQGINRWLTPALALAWLVHTGLRGAATGISLFDMLLAALLAAQALLAVSALLGTMTLSFAGALVAIHIVHLEQTWSSLVTPATYGLLGLWCGSRILACRPRTPVARTFFPGAHHLSLVGLSILTAYHTLGFALSMFFPGNPDWAAGALLIAWSFVCAWQSAKTVPALVGSLGFLALVGSVWTNAPGAELAQPWLWLVLCLTSIIGVLIASRLTRRAARLSATPSGSGFEPLPGERLKAIANPLAATTMSFLTVVGVATLFTSSMPVRGAGAAAVAGLLLHGMLFRHTTVPQLAGILGNWHGIGLLLTLLGLDLANLFQNSTTQFAACAIPLATAAALSGLAFRHGIGRSSPSVSSTLLECHRAVLALVTGGALVWRFTSPPDLLPALDIALAAIAFVAAAVELLWKACRANDVGRVWLAHAVAAAGVLFFWRFGVIRVGQGISMYVVLATGLLLWNLGRLAAHRPATSVLTGPFVKTGLALPLVTVLIGIGRHLSIASPEWLGANSLALLLAAGFYFWRGLETAHKPLLLLSTAILNVALVLLWRELSWSDPQFFMIPLGLSLLGVVELLRREIPRRFVDPLRYAGALTILVSPTFHIVEGSWLHLVTLMVASIGVSLLAIGLQVRALMYAGTAFLIADLLAMVVRGGIDHPNFLWIAGIALGSLVILIGAICENHREVVLQMLRLLAARLEAWQ
jgi:hypothetical protein